MVPAIVAAVRAAGYSCATYVRQDRREDGLSDFVAGKVDVLVASEKIAQGVDGLQERCNRLVIACPPWTGAGYEQVVGRVYRRLSTNTSW
jgi:superfamily II DNA/RNA helicase